MLVLFLSKVGVGIGTVGDAWQCGGWAAAGHDDGMAFVTTGGNE